MLDISAFASLCKRQPPITQQLLGIPPPHCSVQPPHLNLSTNSSTLTPSLASAAAEPTSRAALRSAASGPCRDSRSLSPGGGVAGGREGGAQCHTGGSVSGAADSQWVSASHTAMCNSRSSSSRESNSHRLATYYRACCDQRRAATTTTTTTTPPHLCPTPPTSNMKPPPLQ
jgi:hypothetical protein